MASIYPHLTVELDIEPFFQDLLDEIENGTIRTSMPARIEMEDRQERMNSWFIKHGYICGVDYFVSENGYRVKDKSIVTFFHMAFAR